MPGRTRSRQLRRLASERQAEKHAQRARRERTLRIASWVGVAVLVLGGAFVFLNGRGGDEVPLPTPSETTSSSASPTPAESPGTQVGTVDPSPLAAETACDDNPPAAASEPKPQFNEPAQVIEENTKYFARFETSCGTIVVKLLPQTAPQTVNSFVFLAEQGYFDGQIFHRIDTSIDVIQGGDPTGTGMGGPGYAIPDELSGSDTYGPGVLAMANAGPNTGGSQFFFIAGENGHLLDANPAYTVFGEVVEGLDVLQRILGLPITDPTGASGIAGQRPLQAVYIDVLTISND
jgi:cyclophilin family peptidyl-prolyl cis-trans isomerase